MTRRSRTPPPAAGTMDGRVARPDSFAALDELARLTREFGGYPELEDPMRTYTTYMGTLIEYPAVLPEAVEAFLTRTQAALDDPAVSESAMMVLLFSTENPILQKVELPDGCGASTARITREIIGMPLYAIFQDLMLRKHEQVAAARDGQRRCVLCATGHYTSVARAGRTMRFRDDLAVPVPDDLPLLECDHCGELLISPSDADVLDRALGAAYAKRH